MSERQARWAETLALFNYQLQYRPDALSRREQDIGDKEGTTQSLMAPVTVRSLCHSGDMDHMSGNLPRLPGDHPDTRSTEDPFSGSEDLETPAESEEDDHPLIQRQRQRRTLHYDGGSQKANLGEYGHVARPVASIRDDRLLEGQFVLGAA
ncbi:hypothetical protein E4U12_003399 [Claviceps purpurea]|nr:hypothetical protein E4U12_003399 [Claviceps purpurea]